MTRLARVVYSPGSLGPEAQITARRSGPTLGETHRRYTNWPPKLQVGKPQQDTKASSRIAAIGLLSIAVAVLPLGSARDCVPESKARRSRKRTG
jgi:hypothetical protein